MPWCRTDKTCDGHTWQASQEEHDFHARRLQAKSFNLGVGPHMGVPPCQPGPDAGTTLLKSHIRRKSLLAQPQPKAECPSLRKPGEAPWRPQNASEWMSSMRPGTRLHTERSAAEEAAILEDSAPGKKRRSSVIIPHSAPPQNFQSFPSAVICKRVELLRAHDQAHSQLND